MEREKDSLTCRVNRGARKRTLRDALTALVPLLFLWIGLALLLDGSFASFPLSAPVTALIGLALSAALLALSLTPVRQWVIPGGLVLIALYCLVLLSPVFSGMKTLVNDVLSRLTAVSGRISLPYSEAGDVLPALFPVLLFPALLFTAASLRGSLLPVLPVLAALAAGTVLGVVPVGAGWALFALGVMLLAGGAARGSVRDAAHRASAAGVCVLLALAVGLALQSADLSGLREATARRIHEWRFDSASNSMPEGQIADLGPWEKSDAPALEVTMSRTQKLYLRGHIYEVYTGSAWERTANEERAESEALFYWLHKNGLYGQTQLASAASLTGESEMLRVTVQNVSACREYAYLPYGFADAYQLDAAAIGDTEADGSLTELSVLSGGVARWYETQYVLSESEDPAVQEYLALEESYRAYVTEKDLQMTQESWNVLYRQLGDVSGTHSLYEIQTLIRDYLETHLHYDEDVYTLSGSGDFLHYVLESSDGGAYSVQYATAATLMLRYYGVPARYGEGYYLSPEQAANAQAGQAIVLTEENAHAWAEYYLNGVGFVPFEVTPGYIDPEDLNVGSGASATDDPLFEYESNQMTYVRTEAPDVQKPDYGQKGALGFSPVTLLLLIPLALCVLAVLVLLIRLRLRRSLRRIDEAPDREAVALRYGYAMALKARAPGVTLPEDAEAAALNELALFSQREIAQSERAQMDAYSERVLLACTKQWGFLQKCRLRLVEGLY